MTEEAKNSCEERFVSAVFEKKERDHGFRADFRNALSPRRAYRAWPYLTSFTDINCEVNREAYLLIGASICLDGSESNGGDGLGLALFKSWKKDRGAVGDGKSDPAMMRLRRLLSCQDAVSLCQALRPVLSVVRSKGASSLDYALLLRQILWFDYDPDRVKARWVSEYFPQPEKLETKETGTEDE